CLAWQSPGADTRPGIGAVAEGESPYPATEPSEPRRARPGKAGGRKIIYDCGGTDLECQQNGEGWRIGENAGERQRLGNRPLRGHGPMPVRPTPPPRGG